MNQDSIVLVSDMTNRVNWGARGASLALREILEMHYGNVRALPSWYADEERVPIDTFLPESIAFPLIYRRGKSRLCTAYYRFERMMGMRLDYIECGVTIHRL